MTSKVGDRSDLIHWPLEDLNEIPDEVIFKLILGTDGSGITWEIAIR